jgi:hypothetical protein
VGVLAAVVGANLVTPGIAGAALKEPLRTLLVASQVDVALAAWPPVALWWGNIESMTILARDVQAGDLRLERFGATLHEVRVDARALYAGRTIVIRSIGSGSARGTVSEEALAQALRRQSAVRIDSVALRPGTVRVRGAVRALGMAVAVEGDGRLVLTGGDTVDLILDRASVSGTGSITLGGQLTTRVPSVLRIPPLPLGLRVTGIRMDDRRLVLDAATGPS